MPDYLERNKTLLSEIVQSTILKRGAVIGESEGGTVTSQLGLYYSSHLGQTIHLALKEFKHRGDVEHRGLWDLAMMQVIAEKCPVLYNELPVLYGILRGKSGDSIGIITEDFSNGGKYPVEEIKERGLVVFPDAPHELKGIVVSTEIDNYDLASSVFMVNGRRRLGDFNHLYSGLLPEEVLRNFPVSKVLGELEEHTLRVGYDI